MKQFYADEFYKDENGTVYTGEYNVSPDRKAGSLKGDLKMKCVNCGSIEDVNMVVNMGCGHAEYICDECCRVLDNIHYDFDKNIWCCEDKCLKCYN